MTSVVSWNQQYNEGKGVVQQSPTSERYYRRSFYQGESLATLLSLYIVSITQLPSASHQLETTGITIAYLLEYTVSIVIITAMTGKEEELGLKDSSTSPEPIEKTKTTPWLYLSSVMAPYHCTILWSHVLRKSAVLRCFYFYHKITYNIIIVLYKQNILVVVVVGTFCGKNRNLIVLFQPHWYSLQSRFCFCPTDTYTHTHTHTCSCWGMVLNETQVSGWQYLGLLCLFGDVVIDC